MTDVVVKMLVQGGPAVACVALFLWRDVQRAKLEREEAADSSARWKDKDGATERLVLGFVTAIQQQTAAIQELTQEIGKRPCLYETRMQEILHELEAAARRGSPVVSSVEEAAP